MLFPDDITMVRSVYSVFFIPCIQHSPFSKARFDCSRTRKAQFETELWDWARRLLLAQPRGASRVPAAAASHPLATRWRTEEGGRRRGWSSFSAVAAGLALRVRHAPLML